MILFLLRGISKVTAALTGLLFAYSIGYAMEGMTSRLPMSGLHELLVTTVWILPWALLNCSGFEDLGRATRQAWVPWLGMALALGLLYYFERHTMDAINTKIAMPLLATLVGLMPHVIRRINFIYTICSLVAAIGGIVVVGFAVRTLFSSGQSFATERIAFVVYVFGTSLLTTGVLTLASLRLARSK